MFTGFSSTALTWNEDVGMKHERFRLRVDGKLIQG